MLTITQGQNRQNFVHKVIRACLILELNKNR